MTVCHQGDLLLMIGVMGLVQPFQYPVKSVNNTVMSAEKALYRYLMVDYEPHVRPVVDANNTVMVTIGVMFNQLFDLNERTQVLTTIVALDQIWYDEFLIWNPDDFQGIRMMYFPYDRIWHPDIVLYNSVENINQSPYLASPMTVDHTGQVTWFPLAKLHTSCKLDITFYPFDHQVCYLKLGSWSYGVKEVDVQEGFTGIEKPDFVDNGEFEIVEFKVKRLENIYDCCPYPIITLNVYIHFRRRPMFSMFTIAIPCIMLSLMTTIAFILPPQSEAKLEVQLSVMLSLAVFMLMIGESLPPTSNIVPLIGVHIVLQMGLTALSLICSVFVLRLVHTDYKHVPAKLRRRNMKMAKWLYVGVPDFKAINCHKDKLDRHKTKHKKAYCNCSDMNSEDQKTTLLVEAGTAVGNGIDSKYCRQSLMPKLKCFKCNRNKYDISRIEFIVQQILGHLEGHRLEEQRQKEWRLLGAIVDRILLIMLVLTAFLTTAYIYVIAPYVVQSF